MYTRTMLKIKKLIFYDLSYLKFLNKYLTEINFMVY